MTRVALTPLEIAAGLPLGARQTPPDVLPDPQLDRPPALVLEDLLLPALQRSPCVVSFSGGRDSSAVLAVATTAARRHGLPDPVPMSLRFPSVEKTQEDVWQEQVVRHLRIGEWERRELGGELDVVGPYAQTILRHGGVRYPNNLHFLVPALELARGGSLLTGVGGDELFQHWPYSRWYLTRVMARQPSRAVGQMLAIMLLPSPARRAVNRRQGRMRLPWLTPPAKHQVVEWWARRESNYRPAYAAGLHASLGGRIRELQEAARKELAAQFDVRLEHVFTLLPFISAVTAGLPRTGFASRTAAMDAIFGHLLPADLVRRSTKAVMTDVFWGDHARALVRGWDGIGVDPTLVDVAALRETWSRPRPHFRSWLLAQQVWLGRQGGPSG